MSNKDRQILLHILRHCNEVAETVQRFFASKENFLCDHVFYNACCMAIFQIGELSKRFSDEFKKAHPTLPWNEMRGMRNLFAHEYETINKELLWETVKSDVPSLHDELKLILSATEQKN
ncbi:MAG: DUF86 domain-containing protein [Selenomonadaceae bacterium]|nr:DUF86 domain-containing protein [Selenomonadaceae bacterium]